MSTTKRYEMHVYQTHRCGLFPNYTVHLLLYDLRLFTTFMPPFSRHKLGVDILPTPNSKPDDGGRVTAIIKFMETSGEVLFLSQQQKKRGLSNTYQFIINET